MFSSLSRQSNTKSSFIYCFRIQVLYFLKFGLFYKQIRKCLLLNTFLFSKSLSTLEHSTNDGKLRTLEKGLRREAGSGENMMDGASQEGHNEYVIIKMQLITYILSFKYKLIIIRRD